MNLQQVVDNSRASQNSDELLILLTEVQKINPLVILEIGVHKGYSLEVWQNAFPNAVICGVQDDISDLDEKALNNKVFIVHGDSHDEATLKEVQFRLQTHLEPVDFLFIDGDHTYDGVRRDFNMYAPLVREGGIIALHDASLEGHPMVQVRQFWNEIAGQYKNLLTTGARETGQGIQKVGTGTGILFI